MRKYNFVAKKKDTGDRVKSTIQAETIHDAARTLISQGYLPLDITDADNGGGVFSKLSNHISGKDRIVFLRQLATLIGAGLPLSQSLRTVAEQTNNKKMRSIVDDIIGDVEGGKTLSSAFRKYPEVFDAVVIAFIDAGEASGTLDGALKKVAAQKEKDAAMLGKVRGAMVYPAIVLFVIVAVIVFMLVTIVPQVEKLYSDMHQPLPFLTMILISIEHMLTRFWWAIVALLIVGGYFLAEYLKTENGIRFKDSLKLNVPLFKGMFRKLYMARFSRTGQTLLSTGVAMLDMLRISGESVNNVVIEGGIARAAEKVSSGKALSVALKSEEYILPMVPQMIKIGEQSGKIDEMMGKTAQIYEEELDEEIKAISTAIEPILMVVLAIVVGGLVGAILFPIYSLVGNIH